MELRELRELRELKVVDLEFGYHYQRGSRCQSGSRCQRDPRESGLLISGIGLRVSAGEILVIIGPNGAGKTTLLKCLNKKLSPTGGVVYLDGQDIANLKQKDIARKVGVIPQISHVSFPFRVIDVVRMGRYPHQGFWKELNQEDHRIVDQAMKITGAETLRERLITELSGGEYQRMIFARALAQDPKVLLMDEPTLHLDLSHQLGLLDLIRDLVREKGLIAVIILHDLNMAFRYSDQILLLNQGRIYRYGPSEEVITKENIRQVYQVEVEIYESHADSGNGNGVRPCITPVRVSRLEDQQENQGENQEETQRDVKRDIKEKNQRERQREKMLSLSGDLPAGQSQKYGERA